MKRRLCISSEHQAHVKPSERKQKEKQVPLFAEMADARLPPLDLLDEPPPNLEAISTETLEFTSRLIEKKLRDFNVEAVVVAAYPGPVITRYEIEPAVGEKRQSDRQSCEGLGAGVITGVDSCGRDDSRQEPDGARAPNPRRQVVKLSEILAPSSTTRAHHC